jgi:hypothetical protein
MDLRLPCTPNGAPPSGFLVAGGRLGEDGFSVVDGKPPCGDSDREGVCGIGVNDISDRESPNDGETTEGHPHRESYGGFCAKHRVFSVSKRAVAVPHDTRGETTPWLVR